LTAGQARTRVLDEALRFRVINAAGFITTLGGAPLPADVREAMASAGSVNMEIRALQDWAGQKIAAATGAEAGWVCDGAASGLTLGAAAAIAGQDPGVADTLPHPPGDPEIVVQRTLHNSYDRALRLAGARLVPAGYPSRTGLGRTYRWEIEAAITSRTVALAFSVIPDAGGIPLQEYAAIAHAHGLPVIVDASAELPPTANLHRFIDLGADLVVFSGGKGLRGPQASGMVAGRRDLIAAIRFQSLDMDVDPGIWMAEEGVEPFQHGIGRSMKVGKEEIVGLVAALDLFLRSDHESAATEMEVWLRQVASQIDHAHVYPPKTLGFYPRLTVDRTPDRARHIYRRLAAGDPPVRISQATLETGRVMLCAEAIEPADRPLVAQRFIEAISITYT